MWFLWPAHYIPSNFNFSPANDSNLCSFQVLTSKSCSEEGLEDATAILVNLSDCPAPARSMVLRLLLQGAAMLGATVAQHINSLLEDLRKHAPKNAALESQHSDPSAKGILKDRFTQEEVVVTGLSGSGRHKSSTAGSELQCASMSALTSKTSSQAFFLRTLKVIVQLRDATALHKAKKRAEARRNNRSTAASFIVSSSAPLGEQDAGNNETTAAAAATTEEVNGPAPTAAAGEVERMDESSSEQQQEGETQPPPPQPQPSSEESPSSVAPANTAGSSSAPADPQQQQQSTEAMEVDDKKEEEEDEEEDPDLKSLSSQLNLDELWQALSACLDELAESTDTHAVLVLQPAVEAFFLVHANAAATNANSSSGTRSNRPSQAETRENQLAHLNELPPLSPLPSTSTAEVTDTKEKNKKLDVSETLTDSEKFLAFAERHRSVLNQILRQSTVHLADGPFSVLVDHIRILDFDIKRKYFRTELERADDGNRREDLTVHVRRDHVFEDSFRELHRRSSDEWKNRFYIVFEGEEGQDAGGLLREWYMIISREIFNPMYALFCISPGDRVTYMINSSSHCNSNHLSYFKFVGRVIAKAVYDNKLLECYFTRSFYKHILGKMVRFTDMESEDYSFYQGLVYLMDNDVSSLGYELAFSTEVNTFPPIFSEFWKTILLSKSKLKIQSPGFV